MPGKTHTDHDARNRQIIEKLVHHMPGPGNYPTAIDALTLHRRDELNVPENCFFNPTISVLVQGRKRTIVGNAEYDYGQGQCLVNSLDLPSTNYVYEASPEKPFLVMALNVNKALATQLAAEIPPQMKKVSDEEKTFRLPRWTRMCWMLFFACWNCWTSRTRYRCSLR